MKKTIYLAATALVLLATACTSTQEKTVKLYLQSVNGVQVEGLEVNIKELKELKKVTVGDSITYLNKSAELTIQAQIDAQKALISKYQAEMVAMQTSPAQSRILVDAFTAQIVKTQQNIDSLKSLPAPATLRYDGRKTDEVLAILVECSFEAKDPLLEKESLTKVLVLAPDEKTCYGTTDNADMVPGK